jgi:hypothetical protein
VFETIDQKQIKVEFAEFISQAFYINSSMAVSIGTISLPVWSPCDEIESEAIRAGRALVERAA